MDNDHDDSGDFTRDIEMLFDDTPSFEPQEEIIIDDADLCAKEEWFETESRTVESLKQECHALLKQCHEKKQEIKKFKDLSFSPDCKNDVEIIYQNIEKEVCEDIKSCATQISQNIRSSKNTAQLYLRKLKENTSILSLQFEYIEITEAFTTTCSEWNRRDKILKEVAPGISSFSEIREDRRQQVLKKIEEKRKLSDIDRIINQ